MIVCHCTGVTDDAIRALVRDGVSTVRGIVRRTGAGRCCTPCRDEIRELIDETAAKSAAESELVAAAV
jgi:nitrite reductase (NADH) large subunit